MEIQEKSFFELALELERAHIALDVIRDQHREAESRFMTLNMEMCRRSRELVDCGELEPGVYDWHGTVFEVEKTGRFTVRKEKIRSCADLPGYDQWSERISARRDETEGAEG